MEEWITGPVIGIVALIVTIMGTAATCYGIHCAKMEAKENEHLKKTFRAFVAGLYAPTARAMQFVQDMRIQTADFKKHASPEVADLARKMCIQAGRMEMHVHDQAAMIAKFAQEYLHLDLPRWRELIQEFDENRNTKGNASQAQEGGQSP